ncbi:hypothetical protein Tco_0350328, partial [Tanacetum coccineum]
MGKTGGVPNGEVPDSGVSALVWESMICGGGGGGDTGSGGEGIRGSGDDYGESRDGGGV